MWKRHARKFVVVFGGREAGTIEGTGVRDCLKQLDLVPCSGRHAPMQRRCPGHSLHGHLRGDVVDAASETEYQGRPRRMVTIPPLGPLYFDVDAPPPAFTFRLALPGA